MLLKRGERGLLVGKTGSGKTQNGLFQLMHTPLWPRIIFDTKIEDAFFSLPVGDETLEVIEGLENFIKYAKTSKAKDWPDYLLVRPTGEEYVDPEILDEYARVVYESFGACFFYIDEVVNMHKNGRALPHLMNVLCRGRSRGKTTLMGSQRPAMISRSCLTETDRFYMHKLTDMRDRKTLGEVVPDFADYAPPPEYHFWHYSHKDHEKCELFLPVPEIKFDAAMKKKFKKRWL
jgi:hypothetical protein